MKLTAKAFGAAMLLCTPCAAASNSYAENFAQFEAYLKENQIGAGRDVWLAKSYSGELDRVALFFGYLDDLGACQDAARALNQAFTDAAYTCIYVDAD